MVVAREHYAELIARAFDGAIVVDGQRVIAHKSGMHVVRGDDRAAQHGSSGEVAPAPRVVDPENDWSDV